MEITPSTKKYIDIIVSKVVELFGKEKVYKVYLYGSLVKGDFRASESDIDLLFIVKDKNLLFKLKEVSDLWYELSSKGYIFDIVVLDIREYIRLKSLGSPYLESVEKEGILLYDGGNISVVYATELLSKAIRWLNNAKESLRKGHYDIASAKAYNSIELIIKASLYLKGFTNRIKTHGGKIQKFSEFYVTTNEFPKEIASKLVPCLTIRSRALYEVIEVTEREAKEVIEVAEYMVNWMNKLLKRTRKVQRDITR